MPEVRTTTVAEIRSEGPSRATLLNASGHVTARRSATVSSKVTGKVTEVLVDEGIRVKEGQLLAKLDSSNVDAALKLAEAQLAAARVAMEEIRSNFELAPQATAAALRDS